MCRWKGCTQPPPPLRISHRLKLPFFCCANGVLPALFFRLVATVDGSNCLPLISHSISPPRLPRSTSKINRLSIMVCQFGGTGGRSRNRTLGSGITLLSGASSPITNFSTGTLYAGSGEKRDEFDH